MVRITERISKPLKEDILSIIYNNTEPMHTKKISILLRRSKEYTFKLIKSLEKEGLVERIKKTKFGALYKIRHYWIMPEKIKSKYKEILND